MNVVVHDPLRPGSILLKDRKAVLSCSPRSIAGTMVLLAGSEMATRKLVPEGSERISRIDLWNGWLFSLGWWGDMENKRFGIDVGRADKARNFEDRLV
jgi:hypothetical protein